jgi:hypothetical protein
MGAYAEDAKRTFLSLWRQFVVLRLGTSIGFALFALSLLPYRSYASRPVFGVWSYAFFALVAATYLGLALWVIRALRADRTAARLANPKGAVIAFDLAVLLWGMAYCLSALENSNNAGRVTDLDFFGSIPPIPSIFEWLALCLWALAVLLVIWPRLNNRHANIAVSVAATVFTLLAVEGGFRVYFAIAPMTQGFPTNASANWVRRYSSTNSLGWRDAEHSKTADPSVRRLLVVGDSFAYGDGIKRAEDRFGEQVTAQLVETTGKTWESMNASKGNSHTLDEIEFLRTMLPYQPQVVLLLYVFNDIDYLHMVTPALKMSRFSPLGVLFSNSHLVQQIYLLFIRSVGEGRIDGVAVYKDDELVSRHLVDIKRFVALARPQGARVFVVPMDVSVANSGGPRSGHRNFMQLAEKAGIPVISTLEVFKGVEYRDLIVNSYDHHPNERAYGIAAVHVAGELNRRLVESEQ